MRIKEVLKTESLGNTTSIDNIKIKLNLIKASEDDGKSEVSTAPTTQSNHCEVERRGNRIFASETVRAACCGRRGQSLRILWFPSRLYRDRAKAVAAGVQSRSDDARTRQWYRARHCGSQGATKAGASDNQNSKHAAHFAGHHRGAWLDLSLEISSLHVSRTAMAGNVCGIV